MRKRFDCKHYCEAWDSDAEDCGIMGYPHSSPRNCPIFRRWHPDFFKDENNGKGEEEIRVSDV